MRGYAHMPADDRQPDTGRLITRCILAWIAGASLFVLLIPALPTFYRGFDSGGYGVGATSSNGIPFGSLAHLVVGLCFVLAIAPAAGLFTALLLLKKRRLDLREK